MVQIIPVTIATDGCVANFARFLAAAEHCATGLIVSDGGKAVRM